MPTDIPPEFQSFVSSLIARRRYLSESEVLSEGLRLLQARETPVSYTHLTLPTICSV